MSAEDEEKLLRLGRPVRFLPLTDSKHLPGVSCDVVCLVSNDMSSSLPILRGLLLQHPLALHFVGGAAPALFKWVLKELSGTTKKQSASSQNHVMTYLSDAPSVTDGLIEFFTSTWPSTDRFAMWSGYTVAYLPSEYEEKPLVSGVESMFDVQHPTRRCS